MVNFEGFSHNFPKWIVLMGSDRCSANVVNRKLNTSVNNAPIEMKLDALEPCKVQDGKEVGSKIWDMQNLCKL